MELKSLKDLYVEQLKDLYSAEKQLTEALPKMAKAASSAELKEAFQEHLQETKGHVQRLEQIFKNLDEKPSGETCEAMEGLIEEGEEVVEARGDAAARDAALIAAAQRVEHYEIAGYGTVAAYARTLRRTEDSKILEETLDEEKNADELLNDIALGSVNQAAAKQEGAGNGQGGQEVETDEMSYDDLYQKARDLGISGRSGMNKNQLKKAVERESVKA